MTRRRVLSWGNVICFVVALSLAGLILPADAASSLAAPYDPKCGPDDEICHVWTAFRANHPYPYQGFASARLQGGRALLVASEPPPTLPHAQAEELFGELFADRAPQLMTRRWLTGADGYVEDVLVAFDAPELKGDDLLHAGPLADRIALLGLAWYGSAYGTEVEPIDRNRLKRTGAIAPNLDVTASELRTWLADATVGWSEIEGEKTSATTWTSLVGAGSAGAFRSSDGTLVLLTFNKALLKDPSALQRLEPAFRRYAVASDATVGAVWAGNQVAFVGRGRSHSLAQIPPLRFETFTLLAAQRSDALQQSYERTNAMAGKLINAGFVDWAPIYLSPALQDTEFGSLLDITDQMLKSWSQAGQVDYLYFDYPLRPDHFPFNKPLSDVVHQTDGGTHVLFNWNTAGSAVVLDDGKQKLLTAYRLGSLPITYGSELQAGGPTTTGHLTDLEEKAYAYFAGLGDPNLARVVQYTLIYQTFRAIAADEGQTALSALSGGPSSPGGKVLIDATRAFLAKLESGSVAPPEDWAVDKAVLGKVIDAARQQLAALRSHQSDMSLDRLAAILADPRREDPVKENRGRALAAGVNTYVEGVRQFNADRLAYNARMAALRSDIEKSFVDGDPDDAMVARLTHRGDELKRERAALDKRAEQLKRQDDAFDKFESDRNEVETFRATVNSIVMFSEDLVPVRAAFARANARKVDGWIRTPSFVTSRDSGNDALVGGHNLDARAIRLVADPSVVDLKIAKGPDGPRLLFNPDQAGVANHAADISRALEHDKVEDMSALKTIVAAPKPPRTRHLALNMSAAEPRWTARLGMDVFESKAEFSGSLRTIKDSTPCCPIVAKDANDVLYLADKNPSPPPTAVIRSFGDTASFGRYMRGRGGAEDVLVLDLSTEHVEAIFAGIELDAASPSHFAAFKTAARHLIERSRRLIGGSEPTDHIMLTDLRGDGGSIDVPGGGRAAGERANRLVALARKRTGRAHVEPLSTQEASKVVGGIKWDAAHDGAPLVVRVRFGEPGSMDVVASFRSGNRALNQQTLTNAVKTVTESNPDGFVAKLALTIKHDLLALPNDQLRRVIFVVHDGGTETQFTLAPLRKRAAHG